MSFLDDADRQRFDISAKCTSCERQGRRSRISQPLEHGVGHFLRSESEASTMAFNRLPYFGMTMGSSQVLTHDLQRPSPAQPLSTIWLVLQSRIAQMGSVRVGCVPRELGQAESPRRNAPITTKYAIRMRI